MPFRAPLTPAHSSAYADARMGDRMTTAGVIAGGIVAGVLLVGLFWPVRRITDVTVTPLPPCVTLEQVSAETWQLDHSGCEDAPVQ